MKLNAKDVLKPAAILFAICLIVSAALAGTNALTEGRIAEQASAKAEESRKIVLPEAAWFEEVPLPPEWESNPVYQGWDKEGDGRNVIGYVFETSAKGYGGDVKIMVGVGGSGEISGVVILEHGETPGLGANAVKEEFRNQFKQPLPANGTIEVVKYQTPAQGQIEAMTGATITSRAVTNAVNEALSQLDEVLAWRDKTANS